MRGTGLHEPSAFFENANRFKDRGSRVKNAQPWGSNRAIGILSSSGNRIGFGGSTECTTYVTTLTQKNKIIRAQDPSRLSDTIGGTKSG
jgi:hypothetical protein